MSIVISILAICGGPALFFGILWYLSFSTRVKKSPGRNVSIQEMLTEIEAAIGFGSSGVALILDRLQTRLAAVTADLVAARETGDYTGLKDGDQVAIAWLYQTARLLERKFGDDAADIFCGIETHRDGPTNASLHDIVSYRNWEKLADMLAQIELGMWSKTQAI